MMLRPTRAFFCQFVLLFVLCGSSGLFGSVIISTPAYASGPLSPPMPPALQALQSQLNKAEQAHAAIQQQLQQQAQQSATATRQLNAIAIALIKSSQMPPALATTHALFHGQVNAASLLASSRRQQQQTLQQITHQYHHLSSLYEQASNRLSLLNKLKITYSESQNNLSELEKSALNTAAIEAKNLTKILSNSKNYTQKTLPQPTGIQLPILGRLIGTFRHPHNPRPDGLTFRGEPNSAILSTSQGTVLYSGPFKNFGGLIIIQNQPQTHLIYANLADLTVNANDTVTPGQVLGHLEKDAPSTLYFEVRHHGKPIDPQRWLTQR